MIPQPPVKDIPYASQALPQTHPDRLSALGRFFGMNPADIRHCRVLELGCNDGDNLIPMACTLPDAEFIGIDISTQAIAKGQAMIERLGLSNIRLACLDILEVDDTIGEFDHIIVHGIYSWVPEPVRDKIMAICAATLRPAGIAYISYNTYPGCHLRNIARDIMGFHAGHFDDPRQKITQACAILKFVHKGVPAFAGTYAKVIEDELDHIQSLRPELLSNYLCHDYMAPMYQPFYFSEFMGHAKTHGLKYLAEADLFEMQDLFFPPDVREMLRKLAGDDIVVKEQFMDYMKGRRFRQTLLCREHADIDRVLSVDIVENFLFSSPAKPQTSQGNANPKGEKMDLAAGLSRPDLRFKRAHGFALTPDHPVAKAAIFLLSEIWPERLDFETLFSRAWELAAQHGAVQNGQDALDTAAQDLKGTLFSGVFANVLELHTCNPVFTRTPGDKPRAFAYARRQADTESLVTNICHKTIEIEKPHGRMILSLLDGSLGWEDIFRKAVANIRESHLVIDGRSASQLTDNEIEAEIRSQIENFGRMALLEA